jgi:predicted peptidase
VERTLKKTRRVKVSALFVVFFAVSTSTSVDFAQLRGGMRGGGRGLGPERGCDSRAGIQERTYLLKTTDKKGKEISKKMEYDVFVSSKVHKGEKSPLIIALHGRNMPPSAVLSCLVPGAENGGYIAAAPMGYSETGYYGAGLEPSQDTPLNEGALSEQDVMNVLQLMRTEFKIDEQRIYIVGQSMGGAGALYLGTKYHNIWAAIAASAPAITAAHHPSDLEVAANVPIIVLYGTEDHMVPLGRILPWIEKMKALDMTYEFDEVQGADHPGTIRQGASYIFEFFRKHEKSAASGQ